MGAGCQQGGAAVQDGDLSAPGEDVEGVQVAVADDLGCWRRMIDQPPGGAGEIGAPAPGRRLPQGVQQAGDGDGHVPELARPSADCLPIPT